MARSFKYVGPYDEVHIPVAGLVVKHGQTVVIEDPDVAAGLDGQETWEHVPAKRSTTSKDKD